MATQRVPGPTPARPARRDGSALLNAAILLGIGSLALSSVLLAVGTHVRVGHAAYQREKAFMLADAGITAAVVDLNDHGSGVISPARSMTYFNATHAEQRSTWGFQTAVADIPSGLKRVTSTGFFDRSRVTITADVDLSSDSRTIHALYGFALYAGNSSGSTNYALRIGGTGSGADYVNGDVYCGGDLDRSGDARLRLPEQYVDENGNGHWDEGEPRLDSGTSTYYSNAISQTEFVTYSNSVDPELCLPNGSYDLGEAFVDTIGNGVYDTGEGYTDLDGDGVYTVGEPFEDVDGDGQYDAGEEFVDRGNSQYDSGEMYDDVNGNGIWDAGVPGHWETYYRFGRPRVRWVDPVPAEPFEDEGDGAYEEGEAFSDRNGVYDPGETYFDDRNSHYDYGTMAAGDVTGMQDPDTGQMAAQSGCEPIDPPDLSLMYYELPRDDTAPADALSGWGHDVDVAWAPFDNQGRVRDANNPAHIFVRNPSNRQYTRIQGRNDYFLEDPTTSDSQQTEYINVTENGNDLVYYVDGNVYIHSPSALYYRFQNSGTRITIVANGNITISDEFVYNGGTENPLDALCLIARRNPAQTNSGNIYLGDAQFGTGGDVHAMLYAENNFVDNNLNTSGQPTLSVFGNMTAGNQINLNRSGSTRTRLDVTLDERILNRQSVPPGLPQAQSGERSIVLNYAWDVAPGSWRTFSPLDPGTASQ